MSNNQKFFDASLTLRCQLTNIREIKRMLTLDQVVLFRDTCFGSWLDLMCSDNDPGYVHYILQRRCELPNLTKLIEESDELWFRLIPSYAIRFGQREFYLVTGFHFGPKTAMIDFYSRGSSEEDPCI